MALLLVAEVGPVSEGWVQLFLDLFFHLFFYFCVFCFGARACASLGDLRVFLLPNSPSHPDYSAMRERERGSVDGAWERWQI